MISLLKIVIRSALQNFDHFSREFPLSRPSGVSNHCRSALLWDEMCVPSIWPDPEMNRTHCLRSCGMLISWCPSTELGTQGPSLGGPVSHVGTTNHCQCPALFSIYELNWMIIERGHGWSRATNWDSSMQSFALQSFRKLMLFQLWEIIAWICKIKAKTGRNVALFSQTNDWNIISLLDLFWKEHKTTNTRIL